MCFSPLIVFQTSRINFTFFVPIVKNLFVWVQSKGYSRYVRRSGKNSTVKKSWAFRGPGQNPGLFEFLDKILSFSRSWTKFWAFRGPGQNPGLFEVLGKILGFSSSWTKFWAFRGPGQNPGLLEARG